MNYVQQKEFYVSSDDFSLPYNLKKHYINSTGTCRRMIYSDDNITYTFSRTNFI